MSKFVGASRGRIYVLNSNGELTALDRNTGATVARIPGRVSKVLANSQSDRLYIGGRGGMLQCIRESANNFPVFHANETPDVMASKMMKKPEPDAMEADAEEDPFADVADPFASDDAGDSDPFASDESGDDSDPFATDDSSDSSDEKDPFAEDDSSDDNSEDPFGGDGDESDENDPFGGG